MTVEPSPQDPVQFRRLVEVVRRLRAPGGCPWDRKQTLRTMAPHLLEECHEAIEAIEADDAEGMTEELGDVLMNVMMLAEIAKEAKLFDAEQVAAGIADKLIRRHPHVFGDLKTDDPDEVLRNWEAIKRREKADKGDETPRSVLAGVPPSLPALLRAYRVGQKAARVGFDWPEADGPRAKLDEELGELDEALEQGDQGRIEAELGDVLFALTNVARYAGVDPETALRGTIRRFTSRFQQVENEFGDDLEQTPLADMEAAWQRAKDRESPS